MFKSSAIVLAASLLFSTASLAQNPPFGWHNGPPGPAHPYGPPHGYRDGHPRGLPGLVPGLLLGLGVGMLPYIAQTARAAPGGYPPPAPPGGYAPAPASGPPGRGVTPPGYPAP